MVYLATTSTTKACGTRAARQRPHHTCPPPIYPAQSEARYERTSWTLKEATVERYPYSSHAELREHLTNLHRESLREGARALVGITDPAHRRGARRGCGGTVQAPAGLRIYAAANVACWAVTPYTLAAVPDSLRPHE